MLGLDTTTGDLYDCLNGAWHKIASGGGGTPGGADTQVQFNNAGAFGGIAQVTWNSATSTFESLGAVTIIDDGNANIFIGTDSAPSGNFPPTLSTLNIGIGEHVMDIITSGRENTALGHFALENITTGRDNTALGEETLTEIKTSSNNTAVGAFALDNMKDGVSATDNTAVGFSSQALLLTTGSFNTSIGSNSLRVNLTGNNNTAVGYTADVTTNNLSNATAIGAGAKVSASNSIQLGDTNVTLVNTSGGLGLGGKVSTYNAIATTGNGVASVYGATAQKAESGADASLLSFTPPATIGTYRLSFVLSASAAAGAVVGWTATWTDSNGNAQTPTNLSLTDSGTGLPALTFTLGAAGNLYGSALIDTDASATAIVLKFTMTAGTITAKASATVERLI